MKFGLCGRHYISESPIADNQATINYYPEVVESETGRNNIALYPTPGLSAFGTAIVPAPRGLINIGESTTTGRLFTVIGNGFYEYNSAETRTLRGTLNSSSGNVSMAASDTQLVIVDGTSGYLFTLATNVFVQIASGGFPANPIVAGYSDGYFIVLSTDNYFYISSRNDGSTWAASDRDRVQAPSNSATGMLIVNRQIWIFGDRLTQPFWNSGNSAFPYQANLSGTINMGLAARFGLCVVPDLNTVAWLGHNESGTGVIYIADGFTPVRISDHSFESAVQGYSTISDAVAQSFQIKGHPFLQISFPTADRTWRYDFSTKWWHQALYWNTTTAKYEAHRALFHTHVYGKHIVADRTVGKLYEMKLPSVSGGVGSFTADDGDVIRRVRRCPHIHNENKTIFYRRMEVIVESGLGTSVGQGANPMMVLRVSNDGGKTYAFERSASAGASGQYRKRVLFDYLGSARDRVFELVATDPIPWRLIDGALDAVPGIS